MHKTFFKSPKPSRRGLADAEEVAASALAFLAEEPGRLSRFLADTGLDPGELRAKIGSREIAAAVLGHLLDDETLLLTFTANHQLPPESITELHSLLTGSTGDGT